MTAQVLGLPKANPTDVSKVVDPQTGEPLVVYHGMHADIQEFSHGKAGSATDSETSGQWFYFAPDASRAGGWYANRRDKSSDAALPGGNVMPGYLAACNPLVIRLQMGQNLQGVLAELSRDMGLKAAPSMSDDAVNARWAPEFSHALQERGHDGVMLYTSSGAMQWVSVFASSQIKSATGDISTFNGGKQDIRFSRNVGAQRPPTGSGNFGMDAVQRIKTRALDPDAILLHESLHPPSSVRLPHPIDLRWPMRPSQPELTLHRLQNLQGLQTPTKRHFVQGTPQNRLAQ